MRETSFLNRTGKIFLKSLLVAMALAGFSAQALCSGVLELNEKYLPDLTSADFTSGSVGRAVGLWAQQPLVYPVLFNRKAVAEGTVSLWFRPSRRYLREYDIQTFFSLSDGTRAIRFTLHGEGIPFPCRRLYFPGGHIENIGERESKRFNHLLYTWKDEKSAVYFNGRPVEFGGEIAGSALPLDGSKTFLSLSAVHVMWFDEILILDRYTSAEEAINMYESPSAREIDKNTAFYAGFENTLSASGYVRNDGDVVRMISRVGRIDGMFGADDTPEFYFIVVNTGDTTRNLTLKGVVNNLDRQTVLKKEYPVTIDGGKSEIVRFDMTDIRENGLFWGAFNLAEGTIEITSETIPFARTLLVNKPVHTGEEITTGLVVDQGVAPDFVQWSLVYSEYWQNHEPSPGEFCFERMDFKIDNLVRTGRNPVIMISDPPEWYKAKYRNTATLDGYYYPDTDEDEAMEVWKRYIRALGERYRGKVFDYEVYGEAYFRSNGRHYARLVNITKDVLSKVDPGIRVACNMGGNYEWAKTVAKITAGKADYYTIHPYIWVNGAAATLKDEQYASEYLSFLKDAGANVQLANTEYGVFTFLSQGIDNDGYPLTRREFEESGLWDKWYPTLKARGRDAFVDWYTAAFRAVRGVTLNNVLGCKYEMWWTSGTGGAIADLKFKAHTPSTLSAAYANASALFSGCRYVQRIELGGSNALKGYLFRKGSEYMLVAFTDDDHYDRTATVYLEIEGGKINVLDAYGNSRPVEFSGNIARFDFRANDVFYIRGLSGIPKVSRPVVSAESVSPDIFPGRTSMVRVSLYNPLEEKIEGTVQLLLPASFEKVVSRPAIILPRESIEILFEVRIPSGVTGPQVADVVFATGTRTLKTVVYQAVLPVRTSVVAEYADRAPVIDGDLADWGDAGSFPVKINRPDQVVLGTPYTESYIPRIDWKGPDDLSAVAAVKYDRSNLYVAVRVYDDMVMNSHVWNPSLANDADCVEIFIDGRTIDKQGGDTYTDDVFQIFFAPPVPEFPVPFYFIARPEQKNLPRRPLSGMLFASERTGNGYTMEMKIPLANFRYRTSDVKAGNSIGFDIAVNDRDEETEMRKGRSRLIWSGKKEADANPVHFGRILFGDK